MIRTRIAGVDVWDIVEQHGTPTYVYDRAKIEQRIADLKAFPVIRFAQKACSNIAILALMRQHGVLVDAVSAGEIHRALLAGYSPQQIVYTADVIDHLALEMIDRLEIRVNCGSSDMFSQLGERCPGREITLRINPGFGHGHSQKTNTGGTSSKHGIWHEQLPECLELARKYSLRVTGIHMHIGSGTDFAHLSKVCDALADLVKKAGQEIAIISAGGGLPTPYRESDQPIDITAYTKVWIQTKELLEKSLGKPLELEVEPGRYLVAESGYLLAEVRAVKKQGDQTFVLLNAGFNNLARPIMYGSYHPMSLCPRGGEPTEFSEVVVGGPLCESGDIFTQREGGFVETRQLPKAKVGDVMILGCAGAYGFVMGSNYNSMPYAAEVLISNRTPLLIRRRQSLEELTAGESIPHEISGEPHKQTMGFWENHAPEKAEPLIDGMS